MLNNWKVYFFCFYNVQFFQLGLDCQVFNFFGFNMKQFVLVVVVVVFQVIVFFVEELLFVQIRVFSLVYFFDFVVNNMFDFGCRFIVYFISDGKFEFQVFFIRDQISWFYGEYSLDEVIIVQEIVFDKC